MGADEGFESPNDWRKKPGIVLVLTTRTKAWHYRPRKGIENGYVQEVSLSVDRRRSVESVKLKMSRESGIRRMLGHV